MKYLKTYEQYSVLTPERKEKLLVICKKLFPECDLVTWSSKDKDCIHLRKKISQQKVDGQVWVPIFDEQHIPWYQMCMEVIPKKLFRKEYSKYGEGHIDHKRFQMSRKNPVDYLWEEFVKKYQEYRDMFKVEEDYNFGNLYSDTFDDAPVVDYLEPDYFDIDAGYEDDETEPPNKTGRNDREGKNNLKKSVYRWSAS